LLKKEAKKAEQENILTPKKPEEPEEFATGGRVGFNEGSKLTDYLKTNISASTSSSSPEEGVKVKQEILDGIVSLNIPLSKKLKLLGDLKFGKNRAKVDLSELGKKYGIDLGEEVYKDKYFSPGLGAEYTTDEGTKFNLMVNPEDKGGSISVSRSFANGGSTGLDYLMGIDRKKYANGSLDEFLKSTTLVSPSGKSYDYDFIQSLPQSLNTAINKFGFDAVIGKDGGETGGTVPGKYTPYYSAMEADSGGGTGLKGEYTFLQDYILKPENLVRDYGLEGAKKILTPFRKTITPEPTPAPEIPIAESSPTTSAPVENFINDAVGTGATEDPILDKYSLFVKNYKPTAIPVSNYETFVDQTGILQPHIQSAFSGLSPFFKQQYQTFATANPEKALEAALQDLKFLTATGNRPSYLQDGGRVGYSDGTKPSAEENTPSQAIINRMIAQIKQMSKMGADIDTIKTITGASDQMIKDVLGKASGGSMSTGLDYLMGIDRKNYQQGSTPVDELIINLINSGSGDSTPSPSTTTSTPSTFQPTMMDMLSLAINPVMGIANIASRTKTGLSLAEKAMDAMGIGRGPGGRTEGYGVDSVAGMASGPTHGVDDVNSQSVGADASAGGAAGAAAASAAGANDGPDTGGSFAQGGIVNRTGFKFGTKFGRFWKIARKVWDDINPTGDRKYDAQLVADELAEQIFKTSMDDLPQNAQIDLYALAYNNAPKVDALFRNPQSLSEAAKKGMAASKEMESLGLDVSKNSDFFKYEEMKLSGQLGPEHQVQAYKDKIRDEFYGVIDDTLMKQVEVDDNPQRLAEVYASIKEGLEMQRKGMTPEEIIRVMKQTPRTKNSQGGLNYLMGL
jgi:hypothetical protein